MRLVVADARDLGEVAEKGFDAVLLMGPLYHLVVEADRTAGIEEKHLTGCEKAASYSHRSLVALALWAICSKTFRAGLRIKQKCGRC